MVRKRKPGRRRQRRSQAPKDIASQITAMSKTIQTRRTRLVLNYLTGLVTADGSGNYAVAYGNAPNNSPEWADVTAVWRQYVVRGMLMKFLPYEQYDKSLSTVTPPIYVAEDHRSSATPTATSVTSCARVEMKSSENAWSFEVVARGIRELVWQDVGAPTSLNWIKIYSSGFAAAGNVGYFHLAYLIELKDIN